MSATSYSAVLEALDARELSSIETGLEQRYEALIDSLPQPARSLLANYGRSADTEVDTEKEAALKQMLTPFITHPDDALALSAAYFQADRYMSQLMVAYFGKDYSSMSILNFPPEERVEAFNIQNPEEYIERQWAEHRVAASSPIVNVEAAQQGLMQAYTRLISIEEAPICESAQAAEEAVTKICDQLANIAAKHMAPQGRTI